MLKNVFFHVPASGGRFLVKKSECGERRRTPEKSLECRLGYWTLTVDLSYVKKRMVVFYVLVKVHCFPEYIIAR